MFDPQSDPLGLGLQQRAREKRQLDQNANPAAQAYMSGPLVDPNMDAWFQALGEAGGGKQMKLAGGAPEGGTHQLAGMPAGGNPLLGLMHSGQPQMSAPTPGAMEGLYGAQPGQSNELELRQRRAKMLNQEQPRANRTPYAGS